MTASSPDSPELMDDAAMEALFADTGRLEKSGDRLSRLLLGACRIIQDNGLADQMGPDLASWWSDNPECKAAAVRRVINELSPDQFSVLRDWLEAGNTLDAFTLKEAEKE